MFTKLLCNQGGKILIGGSAIESDGNFVQPTIVEISPDASVVKEELFGPVLYVMRFKVDYSCIHWHKWSCLSFFLDQTDILASGTCRL